MSDARPDDSILDALARRTGRAPRVHLRDAGTGDRHGVLDPKAQALQDELSKADQGKYRILGEIARGGMGVVLRGHDLELGREVAMKVVDADLATREDVLARFVEEAQIGGQLQHPGIVPVYELGLMADERPYFTMKLIKGRTLADMLSRRKGVDDERVRFLRIFESVCQTMAYAHSKGVIHRDLKPANIMVGAFGEVQVVDWGLSKVLRRGGVADELQARDTALSVIETVRSGPGSGSDSLVGNVLGTPAYMSPEQARGEIDALDERTDVFALGSILCEVLTGAPAYVAPEGESTVTLAAMAKLEDAEARLERSTASDDLKEVCREALLPSRAARTRDAEHLATAVHEHLAGLERRVHEESLRAERSRRHVQLAALGGALLLAVGGGWWWTDAQARERRAGLVDSYGELADEALALERAGELEAALGKARSAQVLVESGDATPGLRDRATALVTALGNRRAEEQALAEKRARESRLLAELDELRVDLMSSGFDEFGTFEEAIDANYRRVFAELGFDLEAPDLVERLAELSETSRGIRLARAFDGWALVLRMIRDRAEQSLADADGERAFEAELVTGIGLDLDPDELRAEIRLGLVARDVRAVEELARSVELESLEAPSLFALGAALGELESGRLALRVLTLGADRHPSDFALQSAAAYACEKAELPHRAVTYARAAIALQPELAGMHARLGGNLGMLGQCAESAAAFRRAFELDPEREWPLFDVAWVFLWLGDSREGLRLAEQNLANVWEKARVVGAQPAFSQENLVRWARCRAGDLDRDEYLAWVDAFDEPARNKWPGACQFYATLCPAHLEPRPLRVLELLEPHLEAGLEEWGYWTALAGAYVLVGDGTSAVHAATSLLTYARGVATYQTLGTLLRAAGHRLSGNDRLADLDLASARDARSELYRGHQDAWRGGILDAVFERFEPLAAGR